ncbi:hypothetical protein [Sulfurimonas sp.]
MKIFYLFVFLTALFQGCSNTQQSSYNNSAAWQKAESKKALESLERE